KHHTSKTMQAYLRLVQWGLAHRKLALLSGGVLLAASAAMGPFLAKTFIPASDRGQTTINFELAPGTPLEETVAAAEAMRRIIAQHKEVTGVLAVIGAGAQLDAIGTSSTGEVRAGTLTVKLLPENQRKLSQRQFERLIAPELAAVPGLRVRFGGGEAGETFQLVLVSDSPAVLDRTAEAVERAMRSIPGVGNPAATSGLRRPEIAIRPDTSRAADLGVTSADIATTARVGTIGDTSTLLPKFNLEDRSIPIRTQISREARGDLDELRLLRVPTAGGGSVPLDNVAAVEMGSGPAQITRFDRRRSVTIKADIAGVPLGTVTEQIQALPSIKNLPAEVKQTPYGDSERMNELFGEFAIAIVAGVLLVYCVLVLLFHDFAQPLTIMAALPLSVGGALGLLLASGEALSLPAIIGILMLMGIVTKNSILLVEYALVEIDKGVPRAEALIDACSKRAQPIIMTTVAMGAGMLPIALKIGADADFRAPMAIAVIGGLITSTLLSLFYVPLVFTYVDDIKHWLARSGGFLVLQKS
ncbi:MAG TPA: efflux RND transporter permease subunit, partial [Burkholderiales bacterium]|nr:efflux RND transporter permease subunit [Burkholderiales bacterium]